MSRRSKGICKRSLASRTLLSARPGTSRAPAEQLGGCAVPLSSAAGRVQQSRAAAAAHGVSQRSRDRRGACGGPQGFDALRLRKCGSRSTVAPPACPNWLRTAASRGTIRPVGERRSAAAFWPISATIQKSYALSRARPSRQEASRRRAPPRRLSYDRAGNRRRPLRRPPRRREDCRSPHSHARTGRREFLISL